MMPADEPVSSPGSQLRAAREARGQSVADVAQAIKFGPRQIEALEADDYSALPAPPFVRGFVRSYAKFLKLDPVPLVALLEARAPVVLPDVRPPENMGNAMPVGVRQIPLLVAASVLLLVVALVIGSWHFLGGAKGAAGSAAAIAPRPVAAEQATVPVAPPQLRVDQAAGADSQTVPGGSAAADAGAGNAPVSADVASLRQLVFVFGGKSWIEVKDASQKIIFTGEQSAGSRQAISGQPPFQLVIGNAANVEVQYGERRVDLTPHIRAEVARLTLE